MPLIEKCENLSDQRAKKLMSGNLTMLDIVCFQVLVSEQSCEKQLHTHSLGPFQDLVFENGERGFDLWIFVN